MNNNNLGLLTDEELELIQVENIEKETVTSVTDAASGATGAAAGSIAAAGGAAL